MENDEPILVNMKDTWRHTKDWFWVKSNKQPYKIISPFFDDIHQAKEWYNKQKNES